LTIDDTNDPYGPANPLITVSTGSQSITATVSLVKGLTIDTASTGSLNISGNITGSGNLNITGAGSVTLSGTDTLTGSNVSVASGALLIVNGSLASTSAVTDNGTMNFGGNTGNTILARSLASLNITGVMNIGASTGTAHSVVIVGTGGLTNTGRLDLSNNDLIVKNGNMSDVFNQLKAGFDAGLGYWNGATGIVSASAAGDGRFLTAIGYRMGGAAFDGVNTTSADVLVKYTYYGDADLNGTVNGADYAQIDNGFGLHLSGWSNGDFNYDGVIDGSDYALIDNVFNQLTATGASPLAKIATESLTSAAFGEVSQAVPEPTTLGLLGAGAIGLLGRQRYRCRSLKVDRE